MTVQQSLQASSRLDGLVRQVRMFQGLTFVLAGAIVVGLFGGAGQPPRPRVEKFDEITVGRINVAGPNGINRIVLAHEMPQAPFQGHMLTRTVPPGCAGIIYCASNGDEVGGIAVSGPELVSELGNASGQNSITCSIRAFRDSAIDLLKTQLGLICGKQDIISSGGRGYRFNDWITIRDTRKAETDPIEIEDTPASRRLRILELLGDGGKLRSTCIANHLGCSLKTVKRELETLRLAGRIEFIGPSKTGTYQLVGT